MGEFERIVGLFSKLLDIGARFGVFLMMLLVVADIIIRKPLWPIPGLYDFVSLLGAAAIALAIPYSAVQKGHVQVELFVSKLGPKTQAAIDFFTGLMSLIFFIMVSWQTFVFGSEVKRSGEVSMSAHLEFYPYIYLISLMCFFLCLVIFVEIGKSIKNILR
ncbi:MAG: TRAP transporter small permease subunit [Deltaproteobacteria bacterium]|nr:TRAP transporter small permease subunit [Deltaproteobacteria bacterium]